MTQSREESEDTMCDQFTGLPISTPQTEPVQNNDPLFLNTTLILWCSKTDETHRKRGNNNYIIYDRSILTHIALKPTGKVEEAVPLPQEQISNLILPWVETRL